MKTLLNSSRNHSCQNFPCTEKEKWKSFISIPQIYKKNAIHRNDATTRAACQHGTMFFDLSNNESRSWKIPSQPQLFNPFEESTDAINQQSAGYSQRIKPPGGKTETHYYTVQNRTVSIVGILKVRAQIDWFPHSRKPLCNTASYVT